LETLRRIQNTDTADSALAVWAIKKIEILHPKL
jgi:hypothetical protein